MPLAKPLQSALDGLPHGKEQDALERVWVGRDIVLSARNAAQNCFDGALHESRATSIVELSVGGIKQGGRSTKDKAQQSQLRDCSKCRYSPKVVVSDDALIGGLTVVEVGTKILH